ncbi:MAG: L-threonylcarbamoyladenylate synthase [Patescibacteria group bacterium]
MTHLQIKPREITPAIIDLIVGSLKIGQVVVLPTDTIYGLSCLADRPAAIRKIQRLKGRDPKKPLIALVSSLAMLKKYVLVSRRQEKNLKKIWSAGRPTTVILNHRGRLAPELTGSADGLAVRLPKNEFLIKIIENVKRPLVSTSLNLSGRESIHDLRALLRYFPKKHCRPDLVVDIGPCRKRRPSRLLDWRDEEKPAVLRK